MEPLFENRVLLDKEVLLEWHKREFGKHNRLFMGVHITLVVLYVALAALFGVLAIFLHMPVLWIFFALLVLCAVAFTFNLLFRYRLHVWTLMRRDKGQTYDKEYVTRYYETRFMPMQPYGSGPDAVQMQRYLDEAQLLQQELTEVMRGARKLNAEDKDQLMGFRTKLGDLQRRMESLNAAAAEMSGQSGCGYGQITDFFETENLYIIGHDGSALLLDKDGFERGTAQGFEQFIRKKLQQAARDTEDFRTRRRLLRAARAIHWAEEKPDEAEEKPAKRSEKGPQEPSK